MGTVNINRLAKGERNTTVYLDLENSNIQDDGITVDILSPTNIRSNAAVMGPNFTTVGDEAILELGGGGHNIKAVFGTGVQIGPAGTPNLITAREHFGSRGARVEIDGDFITKGPWFDVRGYGASGNAQSTTGSIDINIDTHRLTLDHGPITAFANAGGGLVTVTSTGCGSMLANGNVATISGSTDYDGAYTVTNVTADSFTITHAFTQTRTGTWAKTNNEIDFQIGQGIFVPGAGTGNSNLITTVENIEIVGGITTIALADPAAVSVPAGTTIDHDDTSAIQSAISALDNTKGIVFLPTGHYRITSSLTLTSSMTIAGTGKGTTIIDCSNMPGGNAAIDTRHDSPIELQLQVELRDFGITGGEYLRTSAIPPYERNITGVFFRGNVEGSLKNVQVSSCRIGFRIRAWVATVLNCSAFYCTKAFDLSWYDDDDPWIDGHKWPNSDNGATNAVMLYGCHSEGGPTGFTVNSAIWEINQITYNIGPHRIAVGDIVEIQNCNPPAYNGQNISVTGVTDDSIIVAQVIAPDPGPFNNGNIIPDRMLQSVAPGWQIDNAPTGWYQGAITYHTTEDHFLNNGDVVVIKGSNAEGYNGAFARIKVIDQRQFQVKAPFPGGACTGDVHAYLPAIGVYMDGFQNSFIGGTIEKRGDLIDMQGPSIGFYIKDNDESFHSPSLIEGCYLEGHETTFVFDGCKGVNVNSCFYYCTGSGDPIVFRNGAEANPISFQNSNYLQRLPDNTFQNEYHNFMLGKLGIGTANPAYKIDVSGGDIAIEGGGKLIFPRGWPAGVVSLEESWGIKYAGDSTHPFQIANGGLLVGYAASGNPCAVGSAAFARNVGVGTTNPASNLQVNQATTGPGLVSVTNGSPIVSGVETEFTNTFRAGDSITVAGQTRTISVIASNTQLTVSSNFTTTQTSVTYTLVGGLRLAVKGNGSFELRKDAFSAMGPVLTLNNKAGAGNTAIYMNGYDVDLGVGPHDPAAAIKSLDNNWSAHLTFSTKIPGASANTLTERVRIQNDGKVGIGTPDPVYKLSVKDANNETQAVFGDGRLELTSQICIGLSSGTTDALLVGYDDYNGYGFVKVRGASSGIGLKDGGNVGIGTTDPKTKLHSTGSTILGVANASAGDANIGTSQVNVYVDETNHKLKFRVKYSNGTTYKTGEISLV